MFFVISNKKYLSAEQLRADTLMSAYFIIKNYPLKASELVLDRYIQQQHKITLKDLCIKLLLNLTYHKNNEGDLVLLFKNQKYDELARLVTYGNGALPGSRILKIALRN